MRLPARTTLLVAALALSAFLFDVFYMIADESPFCWDEAHHSTYSLLIARSLEAKDIGTFWKQTHGQTYWPFLHSWVSAPFLLAGGYSYASARAASAVLGAVAILLLYLLGRKISGPGTGMIAAILLALSPMYHVLSSTAMLENLGLVLTLAAFLLLLKTWESPQPGKSAAAGAVVALLYLTKYIYGAFFGAGVAAFLLSLLVWRGKGIETGRAWKSAPWLAAGFLIVWGSWVLVPPTAPKLSMLFYRIGDTGGWNPFGYTRSDNIFFFIRALYYAYGFSPAVFIIYLGGIVYGAARWRYGRERMLLIFFLVSFIPMSAIVNSQERFIYLGFGPLLVLAGGGAAWAWKRGRTWLRRLGLGVLLLLAAGDAHKLPELYRQCANAVLSVNLHRDQLRFDRSTLFGLTEAPRFLGYPKQYFNPAAAERMSGDTGDIIDYVFSKTDPRYPLCSPVPIGTLSPHLWNWHSILSGRAVATSWNPGCAFFLLLEVEETSPYNRLGNRHLVEGSRKWGEYFRRLAKAGLLREATAAHWQETGLGARIFVRTVSPDHPGWRAAGPPP